VLKRTSSRKGSKPGPPVSALEAGVRLLARRDHSRAELKRKLSGRGHEDEALEAALRQIAASYGQDDLKFARSYVRMRAPTRGPLAISAELAARGVDRQKLETALQGYPESEQLRNATSIAKRMYDRLPRGESDLADRIGARLARRGFSTSIVRAACRAALDNPND
jgi:regulatory protein